VRPILGPFLQAWVLRPVRNKEENLVYAIIQANGRQVKVTPGALVDIDGVARVDGAPLEKGTKVTFDRVLLVEKDAGDVLTGAPFVADAKVLAVIDGESRGPKLRVFKKKRRKGFRKTRGHRSIFTRVRITEIQA
jgi:large subunit ribosomal protein L21